MKRTFLLKTVILLCALVAGSSSVWADDTYTKVTASADINTTDTYIIVCEGTSKAMGTYSSGNQHPNVSVTISSSSITVASTATSKPQEVKLVATETNYFIKYADAAKYLNNSSSANLKVATSQPSDNKGKWTVAITSSEAHMTNVNANTRAITYRAGDYNVFGAYVASNVNGNEYYYAVLYKKVKVNPSITFNDGSVNVGKTIDLSTLFSSNSTGAVTYSITEGGSYATLDGSTLTGVAAGSVTVQASQAATSSYNAKTVTATITVNAALTLSSIAITTAPTKIVYVEGQSFDPTGMVVTATYSDSSTDDVTASCTWTPDGALTLSDTEITISYTENAITKTATQVITVNPYVQPTSVTINLSKSLFGIETSGATATEQSTSVDNVTITTGCPSNAQNKTYYDAAHIRFYDDSYLILQAPSGFVITGISLNRYNDDKWNGDKVTPSTGVFDGTPTASTAPLVWKGAAATVQFDYAAQCRTASVDVTLAEYKNVTITAATWASFSSDVALDFTNTDVTAYIAKEKDANNVTLTEIKKVPANTGIVVNAAAAGTYAIPVLSGDADATTGNLLKPWLTAGEPTETTYYTLAVDNMTDKNPVFYTSEGGTLAAGKAYLVMPSGGGAPSLAVSFGESTGVNDVKSKMEEVRGEYFNLAGQRVAQPTKGLYIVNGKKYVVK